MKLYAILLAIAAFASTFLGGLLPETFRLATQANVPLEHVMYLAALGFILPEAHESDRPAVSLVLSLAGFLLIFLVTRFLNV